MNFENNRVKARRNLILNTIVLSILLIILIVSYILGGRHDRPLYKIFYYVAIILILITYFWRAYKYQVISDKSDKSKSFGNSAYEIINTYFGARFRIGSIFALVMAIVFLIQSSYYFFTRPDLKLISGSLLIMALLLIILSLRMWKVSKPWLKGRFYE